MYYVWVSVNFGYPIVQTHIHDEYSTWWPCRDRFWGLPELTVNICEQSSKAPRKHYGASHVRIEKKVIIARFFVTQLKASFDFLPDLSIEEKACWFSCWKLQFRCLTFSNWHEGFGPQKQHTYTLKVMSSLSIESKVHENNLHISNILNTWIKLTYIKYIQIHHSNLTAVSTVQAINRFFHHGGLSHIGLHMASPLHRLGNITRPRGPFPVQTQVRAPGIKTMTLTAKVIHTAGLRLQEIRTLRPTMTNYSFMKWMIIIIFLMNRHE